MIRYVWQQVASEITAAIDSGEFKPDGCLPPLAMLAERWGASTTAVSRECEHLTASGVLRHRPNGPYYAGGKPQASKPAAATASSEPVMFLTPAECARQARLSKMTIYRLIGDGTIRAKRVGRSFRIHADSWRAYLNDC